jgi:hypothetical protein
MAGTETMRMAMVVGPRIINSTVQFFGFHRGVQVDTLDSCSAPLVSGRTVSITLHHLRIELTLTYCECWMMLAMF